MRCPFLEEAQVRYCEIAPFRKIVEQQVHQADEERCSSAACVECPVAGDRLQRLHGLTRCPFLRESLVQFCSAAPVTKSIPYNDSLQSRCNTDAHRHCPLYLEREHPSGRSGGTVVGSNGDRISVPLHLRYATNHMWIDETEIGVCYVGVDSFLSSTLGEVERVELVSAKGVERPTAVLTVRGVDLTFVFPEPIQVTGSNLHVRAHPSTIEEDPYGAGWLYEGHRFGPEAPSVAARGLIEGEAAAQWMRGEVDRLSAFVHEQIVPAHYDGEAFALDGGGFVQGLAQHLRRAEIFALQREFFSQREVW